MRSSSISAAARLFVAVGAIQLAGLVAVVMYYAFTEGIGQSLGTLSDLCNALGAILSGALIWMLRKGAGGRMTNWQNLAPWVGLAGAAVAPLGSFLVIVNWTGWVLAGLITGVGYALIGVWLLTFALSIQGRAANSPSLQWFGVVTGAFMTLGLLCLPGVLAGVDELESAPWYVGIGLVAGGFGWNLLYAIWSILFGRALATPSEARVSEP